ncbi:serine/threonine-protein kinase [Sphaerisporangium sp. TRM90804]|uniref:serine/threonine protein kinase n=1 Tax=Sphaerisporangium sp. TRM90804 TaxID=3031113 RepID=UPI00244BA874|nr:serine/threonine-protein kinase [Sphaerisporangium sp. TRM90804]MDH2429496.1 protein kinase [Sphaerisporangium sp. TRM90804]
MARGGSGAPGGTPPGVRPLTVGDPVIIGRYLLLGRLGAGGMGVVYLAERPGGGLVALKTPHPVHLADPTLRARFAEEVDFSRRVVPFCTAPVLEDGTDRDRPYLVTEHITGPSLSQVIKARGPLTSDLAYGVALGSAAALVAIHEAGLVHRDLKPGNVLLSPDGPRVIDFGIARDVDAAVAHTQAGQVMGSPGWVAPERLTGGPAIPASDVFAWGCLVAYAATGHHPFGTGDAEVLTRRILVEQPRLASVPKLLWGPVSAALAKEPDERPDAATLLAWLLNAGGVDRSWDPRQAVAAVLEEIWVPVPYPASAGGRLRLVDSGGEAVVDAPATGTTGARAARRSAARRGHASHAGFAALATVSIAAVTVVAAGGNGAGTIDAISGGPQERVPVVMPFQKTPAPGADAGTGGAVVAASGPRRSGGVVHPPGLTHTSTPTAGSTRPGEPSEGTPSRSPWQTPIPSPTRRPTQPSTPEGPETCTNKKGKEKPCPTGEPRPTRTKPKPTVSITQIPEWGDGEETPSPTVPPPTPTAVETPIT